MHMRQQLCRPWLKDPAGLTRFENRNVIYRFDIAFKGSGDVVAARRKLNVEPRPGRCGVDDLLAVFVLDGEIHVGHIDPGLLRENEFEVVIIASLFHHLSFADADSSRHIGKPLFGLSFREKNIHGRGLIRHRSRHHDK